MYVCVLDCPSFLRQPASNKNNHNPAGQLRRSSRNLYQAIAVLNRAVLPAHMDVPLWESRVGALCSVYCLSRAHIGVVVGGLAQQLTELVLGTVNRFGPTVFCAAEQKRIQCRQLLGNCGQ